MENSYQIAKARKIAGTLVLAAAQGETSMTQLATLAARMTHRQWVSISLAAGVPVAEQPCRVLVVAMLAGMA
jgi:hypothetical protein